MISITAAKAGISGIGGAGITIAEGQQLVVDPALSKGSIQLKLFRDDELGDVDAPVDDILHTNDAPAMDVTIKTAGATSIRSNFAYTRFLSRCWRRHGNCHAQCEVISQPPLATTGPVSNASMVNRSWTSPI